MLKTKLIATDTSQAIQCEEVCDWYRICVLAGTNLPGKAGDGSDMQLKRICALSRFHASGLDHERLDCAMADAVRRNARRPLLSVYAGNVRAPAFHSRNGLARIADRRFRVGDCDCSDVVLAKQLV